MNRNHLFLISLFSPSLLDILTVTPTDLRPVNWSVTYLSIHPKHKNLWDNGGHSLMITRQMTTKASNEILNQCTKVYETPEQESFPLYKHSKPLCWRLELFMKNWYEDVRLGYNPSRCSTQTKSGLGVVSGDALNKVDDNFLNWLFYAEQLSELI